MRFVGLWELIFMVEKRRPAVSHLPGSGKNGGQPEGSVFWNGNEDGNHMGKLNANGS